MIQTKSGFAVERFFQELASAGECALVVEHEGVFAPFSANTTERLPSITPMNLLDNIVVNCRTRLVIVTDRKASDLQRTFRVTPRPEIWGRSGLERLHSDDRLQTLSFNTDIDRAFIAIDHFLERDGLGRLTTQKPGSIIVRWGGLSEAEAREARVCALRAFAFLRGSHGISICETLTSIEACYRRNHVPRLLQMLTDELPLLAPIAYLGSETTDANNFQALRNGGLSVLVAPSRTRTDVDAWIQPPDQLIQFLTDWIRARGGEL
jgi:hypothetical protein